MVASTSVLLERRITSCATLEFCSRQAPLYGGYKISRSLDNTLFTSRLKPCTTMTKQSLVQAPPCPVVDHATPYPPPIHRPAVQSFGPPSTLSFDKLSLSRYKNLSQSSGRTSHSEFEMVSKEASPSKTNSTPEDFAVPSYHPFYSGVSESHRYTPTTPPHFPPMRSPIDSPRSTFSSLLSRPRKGSEVTSISIPASPEPPASHALLNTRPPTPISPETKGSRHSQFYFTNDLSIFDVCILPLHIFERR